MKKMKTKAKKVKRKIKRWPVQLTVVSMAALWLLSSHHQTKVAKATQSPEALAPSPAGTEPCLRRGRRLLDPRVHQVSGTGLAHPSSPFSREWTNGSSRPCLAIAPLSLSITANPALSAASCPCSMLRRSVSMFCPLESPMCSFFWPAFFCLSSSLILFLNLCDFLCVCLFLVPARSSTKIADSNKGQG